MGRTRKNNLRASGYLNLVDVGEGLSLLYNGFTSRMDLIPSDVGRMLMTSRDFGDFPFLLPAEKEHLVKRGHLTELTARGELEEFRKLAGHILEEDQRASKRLNSDRAIAFILTYECNLSCVYCYQAALRQNHDIPSMDAGFVEEFFRVYFNKLFPRCHRNKISFLLFGGEPLLPGNRGAIERILHYAGKHGAMVFASTNGVLLPKMLDLMGAEKGKINNVQVTLDGARMFHDRTRIARSGAPTFDAIIHSIRTLIELKTNTSIRLHLHPNGLESTRALTEYLEREKILGQDHVYVYFEPISSFDAKDMPPSYFEGFSELFQRVAFLQNSPPSRFARSLSRFMDGAGMEGRLKARYCAAGSDLLRVVDSRGDIYDCYERAGNMAGRVGTLSGGEVKYLRVGDTHRNRHILNMPGCLRCPAGLYCGGGCMDQARLRRGSIFKPFCHQNRELIGQTLKAYYLLKRAGKAAVGGPPPPSGSAERYGACGLGLASGPPHAPK
ncbi:MAG: radical SAM protein [Desulfobacteraceae bacterium]|nr:radical SAM protein [Desulfobacteraceae bacterium]